MVESSDLEADLQSFLAETLRLRIAPVDRDLELVSSGHLDSMDLVRIAAHLEDVLGVEIPDDDINGEKLGSISRMLAYAEGRSSG
jgi:acyl carrier protein